jgi:hypothetical protein
MTKPRPPGRPTRFDEAATERVAIRLTPIQRRDLKQVAKENRTDLAGVIREAVNEFVSDYRETGVFRLPKP